MVAEGATGSGGLWCFWSDQRPRAILSWSGLGLARIRLRLVDELACKDTRFQEIYQVPGDFRSIERRPNAEGKAHAVAFSNHLLKATREISAPLCEKVKASEH